MSSENYEYKFYQNFVITWDQFYDSGNKKLTDDYFYYTGNVPHEPYAGVGVGGSPGNIGFTPFENYYETITLKNIYSNGYLNLYFDINLNPPKNNPKKIVVKNITSSFTTFQGNSFSLVCPDLFKYPIQFLDSVNNTIKYEEYRDVSLSTLKPKFNLKRLSGTNPLQTANSTSDFPPDNINYVANPSLNFTIVYEYW